MLGLRSGESQAAPIRAHLYLRDVRLVTDRDENAALNLARYGEQVIAGSGPEINGRGADHKTTPGSQVAVKRQPGTAHAGQTGTVPRQRGTAPEIAHS